MIPQDTVNRILETARIEEVVGDFVSLKRRGADFVACCPFHNEKTPSFHVHPSKGFYYCFGCHKGGSAVGFVMDYEHLSYVEALKYLARKYNIEVVEKEETAEEVAARQKNESLLLVTEFAQDLFVKSLQEREGKAIGLQYFHSRGLEDATIEKYGLGWAPQSRVALRDAAAKAGYKEEYLVETGLCSKYDDGTVKDRFFDRVTFPIHSVSGRVIGFGARTLKTDFKGAKYVNSSDSPIYHKEQTLYGIWFAKNEIAKADKCYLVEGYLDVLSMHQLGITNVVASSGTALTDNQIRLIRRFTQNVTIMYDGDSAGIHAAMRGIGMCLRQGLNVRIVLLPDGDDPDSYSRKHTLEEVRAFLAENEQDFITFKSGYLLQGTDNDPLRRADAINEIADTIADIPDAVKRSTFVTACSNRFGIDTQILFDRIKRTMAKAREEELKEAERARRRVEAGLPPEIQDEAPAAAEDSPVPAASLEQMENDRVVGKAERDLLGFILTYGTYPMKFESDSEFYQGDSEDEMQSVFDFITASLGESSFSNSVYKKVYDAYGNLYYEGYSQEAMVKTLMDGPDREAAFVASQLCTSPYELTVKNFKDSLMSVESWLVKFVPRAILVYQGKRIESMLGGLSRELESASAEEQIEIMKKMTTLQRASQNIKVKLGREKE